MKEMLKKAFRSALSLMLVACLILGMSANGLIVLAAGGEENTNGDKTINYVSLGASNVNGYGMHGYLAEDIYEYPLLKETANIYGYKQDTPGSYPVLLKEHFEDKGYTVNLSQMAISSMRAEEVRFLLDDSYTGDAYTDWRFCDVPGYDARWSQNWFYLAGKLEWEAQGNTGTPTQEQAVAALKAAYKQAIKDADLITVDIGVNNFGVYASNQIVSNMYENDMNTIDPELAEIYAEGKAYVMEVLREKAGDMLANMPVESLDHMADTMAYALVGFCLSFDAVMEQIYTLNPDATVVVVSIQNLMHGLYATMEGIEEPLPFGDIFGALVNAANVYTATISPYCDMYAYADVRQDGHVEFFSDELLAYNGDPSTLSQDMKDCFDVYDNDLYIKSRVQQLLAKQLYSAGLLDISAAVALGADIANNLEHFAIAYQNNLLVIPALGDITLKQFFDAGAAGQLPDVAKPYYDGYMVALNTAYDVMAEIMQAGLEIDTLDASSFGEKFGPVEDALLGAFFGTLEDAVGKSIADPTFKFDLNDYYPEGIYKTLAVQAGLSEGFVNTVAAMGIRTGIGNSFYGHPNGNGQVQLKEAIIDALENETSGKEVVIKEAIDLVVKYYDDAYAYAYAEAVKAGYIEEAVAYIDALIAEIEALNLDEVEMTDAFRAEANALRAEILATLRAAKALLIEADVLDQASLNALLALLNKAGNAMWQLTAVLEQAAIDVNQLAIIPALKAAHDELMNEVLPAIDAALQKAVAEGTAWLMAKTSQALKDLAQAAYELALEAAPEIADAVYDYLYNNPEEVIAFFAEYGDEMLYLVDEYGDEVLMVVAYVAYSYGPEIAEFVIENHETILKAMINWLEVHGENTAALLQVYAEALGLCDAVREQIEILENAVIELNKQAEAQIAILEAEIAALKAQLENASAELKAEIEAKIAELEAQIEMLKAEVAAKIAEVKAAIAELEAALQAAIEKGLADMAALKEAIENLDEKVLELIAAAKKTAIEEIIAATENVQAALENLDATVEELAGEVYEELKDLLANAVDALIEATIEAAKKYAPEIADAIYNYLYNNPEEVIAFFTEYGDEMLALVEEYGDEALMVIGYFLYLYGEDIAEFVIENHEEILAGICAWIDVHGENTAALLQVYAETLGLCDAVRDQIADLEAKLEELQAELEELKAQLENAANELNEEILAQIEKVEQEIAKVEKALEELKEQLEELYNQIVEIAEAIKEVAEAIKNLNDIIEGKIEGSINEAIDNVQDALEHLADVLVAVEELVEQINEMIDELQEIGEKIDNAINEMIETVEEIKAAIEELNEKVEETIAKIEAAIEEIEKAADELIAEAETALEALKEMAEELKDAVNAAIEDLIAKVREAYENAIRADYEIDRKSYYVGIGDDSAVADGYVEKLAEALGMTERFNNLAQEGLTVEDAFALIQEEMAEIAKADLITIGFNNVAATTNMFNTIAGMGKVDTDWMGLLGAEYTTYVDEALAEINAKLLEEGLDEATAALLTEAVNAYAYTYASRELYYPELVNAIHEISPEALVVIVGTYNDLEGVVLDMGGTEIAVGEYVQYLIDAANLQNLIYAMLTENTIYVDAPAVDTLFEEAVAEGSINVVGPQTYIFALMMGYMNPSETGHEYIKDQILNALNVTRATKLGDVNHDGLVDVEDAMLIQQYDAFLVGEEDLDLSVADVSGDGVVDVEDAMLIQQYDAFIIDVFPAEEEA